MWCFKLTFENTVVKSFILTAEGGGGGGGGGGGCYFELCRVTHLRRDVTPLAEIDFKVVEG